MSDRTTRPDPERELQELRRSNELLISELSDLKQQQKQLQMLASFPRMNPNPVMEIGMDGSLKYLNPATLKLFPDLEAKGVLHPFLLNFDHIVESLRKDHTASPVTEVQVGDSWYYCISSIVPGGDSVRIYAVDISKRRRAEEELKKSEAIYRAIGESIDFGIWICEPDGRNIYASDSFLELVGITQEQCSNFGWGDVLHPDEAEATIAAWKECVKTGGRWDREHRFRGADGQWYPILARGEPVRDDQGEITCWAGINLDMRSIKRVENELHHLNEELESRVMERTADLLKIAEKLKEEIAERTLAQERVARLNRLYTLRSRVNEAIVRIHDTTELYRKVCRIVVEQGLFKMAWIGIADPETREVKPSAQWGDDNGYLDTIRIIAADVPEGRGPTGRAVYELRSVICRDIANDPVMLHWRDRALAHGFLSSAAIPLRAGSVVVGALTVYAGEPQFFSDEEIYLLESLTEDISHATDALDNEKRRKQAETDLIRSARQIEELYNSAPCGYHSLDKDGVIIRINDTELGWTGYTREEVVGKKRFTDFLTSDGIQRFNREFPEFIKKGQVSNIEADIRLRDGSTIPILLSSTAIYDETGSFVMDSATLYDITDRKIREKHIMSMNDLLKLFSSAQTKKQYLDQLIALLGRWSECRCIGVRLTDHGGNIVYGSSTGFTPEFLKCEDNLSLENPECICHRVIGDIREPAESAFVTPYGSFVCNDLPEIFATGASGGDISYRKTCLLHNHLSQGIIPIRYKGEILGALHLADNRRSMLPATLVEFIESMTPVIGEALYRFNIEEALLVSSRKFRDLSKHLLDAREDERIRIGREIHDELGQILTAADIELGRAIKKSGPDDPLAQKLSEVSELIDVALEDVQRICSELRPRVLDHLGLTAALEWQAEEFSNRSGIRCSLDLPPQINLSGEISTALFRIFQEVLTNVARHSGANEVSARLIADGTVSFEIRDNGRGISEAEIAHHDSYGIIGIKERAFQLGGTVDISGSKGKGTTVTVKIPLDIQEGNDA
ncbi:MAG: PAS domain S-box protein [Nitrospirae bacterium]|nr:MAG: PAS domain S-box protein [Nitrospirota bacterium]